MNITKIQSESGCLRVLYEFFFALYNFNIFFLAHFHLSRYKFYTNEKQRSCALFQSRNAKQTTTVVESLHTK